MINEMDASCHFGDHYWMPNGRCSNCYRFNGSLLRLAAFEKAERAGTVTLHGGEDNFNSHFHLTLAAAAKCRNPNPELIVAEAGEP